MKLAVRIRDHPISDRVTDQRIHERTRSDNRAVRRSRWRCESSCSIVDRGIHYLNDFHRSIDRHLIGCRRRHADMVTVHKLDKADKLDASGDSRER